MIPELPPFEYFVGPVPNTAQAAAFHISYEFLNVSKLIWDFHSDIMFSRFSKNSRQYNTMYKLLDPYTLKGVLDTIVCHIFSQDLDLLKIFPQQTRIHLLLKDTIFTPMDIFYNNKIVVKGSRDSDKAKRVRPLPGKFTYANMKRLRPILIRYAKCLQLIKTFSKTVKFRHIHKVKLKKVLNKMTRYLNYMLDQTSLYPVIEEFRILGLPAGHTPETLAAEHTFEQVKDMLLGHPSKLRISDA